MVMINLTGAIFQAYIFGELAVLIAQVGTKAKRQQETIDNANTAMENVNLPGPLRDEIREFFKGTGETKMIADELNSFLDKLSPSLQIRVRTEMFIDTLKEKNKIIKLTMTKIYSSQQQVALAQSVIAPANQLKDDESQRRDKAFLGSILMGLGNWLRDPEQSVIKQDELMDGDGS